MQSGWGDGSGGPLREYAALPKPDVLFAAAPLEDDACSSPAPEVLFAAAPLEDDAYVRVCAACAP
jgi:hypothetical protein